MVVLQNVSSTYCEKTQLFRLLQPIVTPEITVNLPFYSDGFSSPWFVRWYVNRVEKGWIAAWIHDYCYVNAINTKAWADLLFYKNLRRCGVGKKKARRMYFAVHYFGKGNY